MKRDVFTMPLDLGRELIIDNFAGGGGTSTGLEQAFGRPVDIAINHDPEALAMHAINHPHTKHLCESVWDVDPIEVTGNQPVALVWLSPDCKHFSKAKGGTPVAKHIRGLAWVGMRWIALTKPRVLMLENVEEFQEWGPLVIDADGTARPDPAKKGKTFESFVRQLRGHGYTVDWRELRACDAGAPTIRKRLFLIARRDGRPIIWPEATHGAPTDKSVLAGKLLPWRTAAECIDFDLPAKSLFGRDRELAENTQRRVAKGLWRHVLTSSSPFIVGVGGRMGQSPARSVGSPAQTITSKADSCLAQPVLAPVVVGTGGPEYSGRPASVDQPLGSVVAENHRAVAGAHLVTVGYGERPGQEPRTQDIEKPLGTVVAGGVKQYVSQAYLTKFNTGSIGSGLDEPVRTVTAGGTPKRASTGIQMGLVNAEMAQAEVPFVAGLAHGARADGSDSGDRSHDLGEPMRTIHAGGGNQAVVAAHLVDMGHGESSSTGAKRWSHGTRDLEKPLNTVTASGATSALAAVHLTHLTHQDNRSGYSLDEPVKTVTGANRGEQALVAAYLEQAYGGFNEGNDGRPVDQPVSTVMSKGANQRLITAYCVKYYSSGGQSSDLTDPLHTLPTKGRMGLVQTEQVPAAFLAPEHADRARRCADLLHRFLPEHFPDPAEMVLVFQQGQWWVLVDITLRMLKPRELFNAQGFPADYVIEEIPDPALLFKDGVQAADPLGIRRKPLTATAQVRMCGNSVSPPQARALVAANFAHERALYGEAA